jgi:hypothetical protein
MSRSLNGILVFSFFIFAFSSCTNESEVKGEEVKQPDLPAPVVSYALDVNLSKFIGNTAIPDFRFDPDFVKQNKIMEILAIEKAVMNKTPKDTLVFAPAYVWKFDSTGNLRKHLFFPKQKAPVHTEHYLMKEQLKELALHNVNPENDAVTVLEYDGKKLKRQTRTEPQTADTTSFYYNSSGIVDSIAVSSMTGKKFYSRFFRYDNGVIRQRILKVAGTDSLIKDWYYNYGEDGRLTAIRETNSGGSYLFKWDASGKLIFVQYMLGVQLVFEKEYVYDAKGLLEKLVLKTGEGKSEFSFLYKFQEIKK